MRSVFKNIDCVKQFEKYLKSQLGRAFAKKSFGKGDKKQLFKGAFDRSL